MYKTIHIDYHSPVQSSQYLKNIAGNIKEKTVKMDRKDFLPENDRFNTITRNDENFSQTLLSLKQAKIGFYNTGRWLENMNESDLNIMKSFTRHNDTGEFSTTEMKKPSNKHRSISTRRVSQTDRRDGTKSKPRKQIPLNAESFGVEKDSPCFQALLEVHKKYTKLKRHYRKEHKHYIG